MREDAILGLVLISSKDLVEGQSVETDHELSDHKLIQLKLNCKRDKCRYLTKTALTLLWGWVPPWENDSELPAEWRWKRLTWVYDAQSMVFLVERGKYWYGFTQHSWGTLFGKLHPVLVIYSQKRLTQVATGAEEEYWGGKGAEYLCSWMGAASKQT